MYSRSVFIRCLFSDSDTARELAWAISPAIDENNSLVDERMKSIGIKSNFSKWGLCSLENIPSHNDKFCEFEIEKEESDKLPASFIKTLNSKGAEVILLRETGEENEEGTPNQTKIYISGEKKSKKAAIDAAMGMDVDTGLLVSISLESTKSIKHHLNKLGKGWESKTIFGRPAIIVLFDICNDSKVIADVLKNRKFDASIINTVNGESLLHTLVLKFNDFPILIYELLIENGVLLDHQDINGDTALHLLMHKQRNMTKAVEISATCTNVNLENHLGFRPIDNICLRETAGPLVGRFGSIVGSIDECYVEKMTKMGVDLDYVGQHGSMAWLACKNNPHLYQILMEKGHEKTAGKLIYNSNFISNCITAIEHDDIATLSESIEANEYDIDTVITLAAISCEFRRYKALRCLTERFENILYLVKVTNGKTLGEWFGPGTNNRLCGNDEFELFRLLLTQIPDDILLDNVSSIIREVDSLLYEFHEISSCKRLELVSNFIKRLSENKFDFKSINETSYYQDLLKNRFFNITGSETYKEKFSSYGIDIPGLYQKQRKKEDKIRKRENLEKATADSLNAVKSGDTKTLVNILTSIEGRLPYQDLFATACEHRQSGPFFVLVDHSAVKPNIFQSGRQKTYNSWFLRGSIYKRKGLDEFDMFKYLLDQVPEDQLLTSAEFIFQPVASILDEFGNTLSEPCLELALSLIERFNRAGAQIDKSSRQYKAFLKSLKKIPNSHTLAESLS